MALKQNYTNRVVDTTKNATQIFDIVDSEGNVLMTNVHLVDKTVYSQAGDSFGALDINTTNKTINELFRVDGNDLYINI